MKYISFSLALFLSTLSPIFASSGAFLDADAQLKRLEELKVGRAPSAAFPELMLQLQDNARAIRARVGAGLQASFDAAHKEIEGACSQDLTLFKFNMAHYVYAHFLTAAQTGTALDTDGVATNLVHIKDITTIPEFGKELAKSPVELIAAAANHGLYPYTFVSEDGVLRCDTLNKSFAMRMPFCGLPLNLSYFDGFYDTHGLQHLEHDWGHVCFQHLITEKDCEKLILRETYDVYHTLYAQVSRIEDTRTRAADQLILLLMMHEAQNTFYESWKGQTHETIVKGFSTYTVPVRVFNFHASCDLTQKHFVQLIDIPQITFRESVESDRLIARNVLEITPGYEDKTVADIMGTHHADKTTSLDWQPILKDLNLAKNTLADGDDHTHELGFSAYSFLYDIRGALQEGDVPFTIWNTDGTFNADGMKAVLAALVEGFRDRHAPHFT